MRTVEECVSLIDMKHASKQSDIVSVSPDVLGGTPVFVGTRVPIKNLFDYLKGGEPLDEFLEDFPSVSREAVERLLDVAHHQLGSGDTPNEAAA